MLMSTLRMLRLLSMLRVHRRWHIIRMIRPMVRHLIWILIFIVRIFTFLFIQRILLEFFLIGSYILLIINWISIRIVVVWRYTFITLRHSFVMLWVLVVNFLICLFIVFWVRLYMLRRIMWGMHLQWWIRIRIVGHSWIHFPFWPILIFLIGSLIFDSSVILLWATWATGRRWIW